MEQIECSETSAYKIQTPGNHPEENIQHTEHGESLKSKKLQVTYTLNGNSDNNHYSTAVLCIVIFKLFNHFNILQLSCIMTHL
jgi:hypothetical protein